MSKGSNMGQKMNRNRANKKFRNEQPTPLKRSNHNMEIKAGIHDIPMVITPHQVWLSVSSRHEVVILDMLPELSTLELVQSVALDTLTALSKFQ